MYQGAVSKSRFQWGDRWHVQGLGYASRKGGAQREKKVKHKWGEADFPPLQIFQGRPFSITHSYPVTHPFPRVLECSSYWESSPSESIFPAVYLFPELAEVYFWYSRDLASSLPSSSVVYLISCRVGNYVQNLRDPLSIVSYACSDKYMPQILRLYLQCVAADCWSR